MLFWLILKSIAGIAYGAVESGGIAAAVRGIGFVGTVILDGPFLFYLPSRTAVLMREWKNVAEGGEHSSPLLCHSSHTLRMTGGRGL